MIAFVRPEALLEEHGHPVQRAWVRDTLALDILEPPDRDCLLWVVATTNILKSVSSFEKKYSLVFRSEIGVLQQIY